MRDRATFDKKRRRILVWAARHRLLMLYAREARFRHGLGPGVTPLMAAYRRLEEEGLASLSDHGLNWHWPDDDQATNLDVGRAFPTAATLASVVGLALLCGAALMGGLP
jgi:hypothetical protein